MTLEDGHIGGLKNPPAKTIEIKKGKPLIPGIGIQGNSSLSAGSVTADVLAGELVQRMFLPENRCSGYSCRRTGTADVFYRETVRLINHKPPPPDGGISSSYGKENNLARTRRKRFLYIFLNPDRSSKTGRPDAIWPSERPVREFKGGPAGISPAG